jgi:phosphoribosylaminoimidazolecarboxamide formyltransferase/IMP cyclohydrolase
VLQGKSKALRILEAKPRSPSGRSLRQVAGGWLLQVRRQGVGASGDSTSCAVPCLAAPRPCLCGASATAAATRTRHHQQGADSLSPEEITFTVAGEVQPTPQQLEDLKFAWRCVKHVKSNAITVAKGGKLLGMGSGQPNRYGWGWACVCVCVCVGGGCVCVSTCVRVRRVVRMPRLQLLPAGSGASS